MSIHSITNTVAAEAAAKARQEAAVAEVIKALTTVANSAKEELWATEVTNKTGLSKIAGLVIYFWNRSAAVAKDKDSVITIAEFKNATVDLVNAVARRQLSKTETVTLGLDGVTLSGNDGYKTRNQIGEANEDAKDKFDNFYAVFKKRVSQLNVGENHEDFAAYAGGAQKMILDHARTFKKYPKILLKQLELTELKAFKGKILLDMAKGYASQEELADINPDSFNAKVKLIREFFNGVSQPQAETVLRDAIINQRTQKTLLDAGDEFTNPSEQSESFTATKALIEPELTTKKDALQDEYLELCGTPEETQRLRNLFQAGNIQGSGKIHEAYTAK